ncbi:hypothetical protein QN277_022778 [Acacia crassicarpa]|uniref:Uncharacterized protein n=1 Tax=Acacia crassicarpa TaxID=499986 RepID=A0AAE1MQ21_9FABA|nr:hypothetical protein QN277_022778 [Acacia crassicarpa]
MASQSTYSHSLASSSTHHILFSSSMIKTLPIHLPPNNTFPGASRLKRANAIVSQKNHDLRAKSISSGISQPKTSSEVFPKFNWNNEIDQVKQEEDEDVLEERVEKIRMKLKSNEGENIISVSAYDTAMVALVEDVNGSGAPQFPESLKWIIDNQLPDGSWGDACKFLSYDRLLCTLASVIALTRYNVHPDKAHKGSFLMWN